MRVVACQIVLVTGLSTARSPTSDSIRQDGETTKRAPDALASHSTTEAWLLMVRFLAALGIGYVLGAKAGRKRYEQINRAYRSIAESPATKKAVDVGRQKLSEKLSTQPKLTELRAIDDDTTVLGPDENRNN